MSTPTITDVARLAGTSVATVSRYFNDPTKVGAKTASRIEDAAAKISYIRNRAAASTRGQLSGTIGLLVPTVENSIFAELIESLTRQLRLHGQTMMIASDSYLADNEAPAIRSFVEQGVDGVILIGADHDETTFALLEARAIPTICLWHYAPQCQRETIGIDNQAIGYEAARYLLSLGHHKIACLFGVGKGNDRAASRQKGALQAFQEAGIAMTPEWVRQSHYDLRAAKTLASDMLSDANRPTAILCGNDILAFAALWSAQETGLHVPDDISIMGIGDFQGAAEMVPSLSTIRIPAHLIGTLSANRLMELVRGTHDPKIRHLKIDFELKERQSTSAPKMA